MKVLNYAGSEFVTGDEIAAALMRYSEALAEDQTAATVSIPVRAPDGTTAVATFLVGPASQIVATDAADGDDELSQPEVVAHLDALTRALHPTAVSSRDDGQDQRLDEAWIDEI